MTRFINAEVFEQGRKLEQAFFGFQQLLLAQIRAEHSPNGDSMFPDDQMAVLQDVADLLRQAKEKLTTSDVWIDAHRDPKDQSYRIALQD